MQEVDAVPYDCGAVEGDLQESGSQGRRWRGWMGMGALGASVSGLFSLMAFNLNVSAPPSVERFTYQQTQEAAQEPSAVVTIVEYMLPVSNAIWLAADKPWEWMGVATYHQHIQARDTAYDIAGIDPQNPADDEKRFALYRDLGVAVRDTEDSTYRGVLVPFQSWVGYIRDNSSVDVNRWEGLQDIVAEGSWKEYVAALGTALARADTAYPESDANGVVDDDEWNWMLRDMGYRTPRDAVREVTGQFELAAERGPGAVRYNAQDILARLAEDPAYVVGDVPEKIPVSKLKSYAGL